MIARVLSNTWATVVLLLGGLACLTVLLVTHTIGWAELRAAVPALIYGAAVAWQRGTAAAAVAEPKELR